MAQIIFIRLLSNHSDVASDPDQQVEWCVSDGIGRPTVQRESLSAVLQTAGSREVIVLVPADDIVLAEVNLPIKQRAKLLQAAPYALEDQIAEDVDKLHFAVSDKQPDGNTPVFAVAHKKMQQWMSLFDEADITPKAIVPDVLCLPGPVDHEHWALLLEGSHTTVRTDLAKGFTCDSEALADYLSLAEAGENLHVKIASINADNELAVSALPVQNIDVDSSMRFGLEAMRLSSDVIRFNLMQGQYSAQSSYDNWWHPYRSTAALLLLAVLISTASHAVDYFRLNAELNSIEAANSEAISRLFPEIKTLVPGSEQIQLQRRLDELRGSGNKSGLFSPLSQLAQSLQAVGSLSLQELQLRDSILFMSLLAKDIATLERLKRHYEGQSDWDFEVQSANSSSEGVQIRASLKDAKS